MTLEERELLQGMVDDIFEQFVKTVAEGRRLPEDRVRKIADGRVFTGRQAMAVGLVDELGNVEDAIDRAGQLAGLAPGFDVVEFGRLTPFERLLFGMGARRARLQDILPGPDGLGRPDLWGWLIDPARGQ
jgi:protease-4